MKSVLFLNENQITSLPDCGVNPHRYMCWNMEGIAVNGHWVVSISLHAIASEKSFLSTSKNEKETNTL